MKTKLALSLAAAVACVAACAESLTCASPDGKNALTFALGEKGEPTYSFSCGGKIVVEPSTLGFDIKALGKDAFDGRKPGELRTGFVLAGVERASADETWKPVWGEESEIRDCHEEMLVKLVQKGTGRRMDLRFRVFDDGMGFRYEFPADEDNSVARLVPGENIAPEGKTQPLTHFTIVEERTRFNLPCDATAWWIPADYETQEYRYTKSRVSEIPSLFKAAPDANLSSTLTDFPAVQTALMLKYDNGLLVNIHEAACVDYATMHLKVEGTSFESSLTPDATGAKGWMQTPCKSPWRTLIVGDRGADILSSRITLNLNEPCAIEDTSWIHPVKYIGVWWTMITGAKNWAYMPDPSMHAANTTNVMRHIDFAAEHGFDEVLVEGWDIGFEDWFGKEKDAVFDFVTPYPDFDLEGLNKYAHEKGVKLMMYHETSASTRNYERHLDEAYALMNRLGYDSVKSGYVGNMLPHGEHHYSQWSNNHYLYCIKEAAKRKIMVNQHEAVRPTGLCRTWPNLIGNEAARGTEYESFGGNNADHTTILPFTRLVGGPMDYTPGIFETDLSKICSWKKQRISSTLAGQLALYVTMFSPLQMAADVPESYEKRLDALQFIKDVPCDWDESRYLEAEIGDYLTIVRKAKGKDEWYLGMKADENAHEADIALDFLTPGVAYEAAIYADAPDAVYRTETAGNYVIEKRTVSASDRLHLRAAPGGGAAVSFKPVRAARLRGFNLLDMFSVDYTSGTFREEDFELIEKWGFNFARLPIDYRFLVKGRDSKNWTDFDEDALRRLDAAVEMGRRHKVHVQLCLHRIPGYCVNPPAEPTDLFSDPEALRVACLHWKTLAKRYKGVPAAELSINLFNEPKYMEEEKYVAVVEALVAAIREVDTERPIVVDGIGYGRVVPKSLIGKNVGFSWHCYDPFFVTHHKAPWADPSGTSEEPRWPVDGRSQEKWLAEETYDAKGWSEAIASGAPVHVGEFGVWRKTRHEVALGLMEDQLKMWKGLGVGWALWNLRGDFGVLDSGRDDVAYEDFGGHKLDRQMLELLQRY